MSDNGTGYIDWKVIYLYLVVRVTRKDENVYGQEVEKEGKIIQERVSGKETISHWYASFHIKKKIKA